jgi:Putative transposase
MTLQAEEFGRRSLLHVLPEGFQRIRYYGLLANRYENRNWHAAETCWACRHPKQRNAPNRVQLAVNHDFA